jgi:hypothetical protein
MKKSGDLSYFLSDPKDSMPNIVYALSKAGKKKYSKTVSALDKLKNVEQLVDKITENTLFILIGPPPKETVSKYTNLMLKAAVISFENAMLEWGESGSPDVEALINTSISSAKRILFLQNVPPEFLKAIKDSLKMERDLLLGELEKEGARLGQ